MTKLHLVCGSCRWSFKWSCESHTIFAKPDYQSGNL